MHPQLDAIRTRSFNAEDLRMPGVSPPHSAHDFYDTMQRPRINLLFPTVEF